MAGGRWGKAGGWDGRGSPPAGNRTDWTRYSRAATTRSPIAPGHGTWAPEQEAPGAEPVPANNVARGKGWKAAVAIRRVLNPVWLALVSNGRSAASSGFPTADSCSGNRRNWPGPQRAQETLRRRGPEPLPSRGVSSGPRTALPCHPPGEPGQVKPIKASQNRRKRSVLGKSVLNVKQAIPGCKQNPTVFRDLSSGST